MAKDVEHIGGRDVRLTHLAKVLYPATGTTKGDVLDYLRQVAPVMLPHCAGRPATRKRWPSGVGTPEEPGEVFFQKNLGQGVPDWVARVTIEHADHSNVYPLVDDVATLAWLAQIGALELHVPQWRVGSDGRPRNPDRVVLDLDPGEGAGLVECVEVATLARRRLQDVGLEPVPVTSGSKGIHLYAPLDGSHDSTYIKEFAHELARSLEADHPDLVVSRMTKSLRRGKVLLDWSQNHENKTTVAPYSLRGRQHPTVAAPRTWRELSHPSLAQLEIADVLRRVERRGDPMAELGEAEDEAGDQPARDRLEIYRTRRDAAKTPEPVPAAGAEEADGHGDDPGEPIFVIQRHHASRLHDDFRLARDGVLVSWALPKGVPMSTTKNHLAVQTEDHPMGYATFAGTIPQGEYGGGEVEIWDHGTYELEKWRVGEEIIATLHGRPDGGLATEGPGRTSRFALIHTGGRGGKQPEQWLIHLMAADRDNVNSDDDSDSDTDTDTDTVDPAGGGAPRLPAPVAPMLATLPATTPSGTAGSGTAPSRTTLSGTAELADPSRWAMEMKWDGVRAIALVAGDQLRLLSRNGNDTTATYPELAELTACVCEPVVLDGEIVALNPRGRPDFALLQQRMQRQDPAAVARAAEQIPIRFMAFDVLRVGERDVTSRTYDERRELLAEVLDDAAGEHIEAPPAFEGDLPAAMAASREWQLEGVVAKRRDSHYLPGRRAKTWLKLKHTRSQEAVVIGWRPGQGERTGRVGSLLLAVPHDDGLRYIGRVGTGFSMREATQWVEYLERGERKTPPADVPRAAARDARWVTPKDVAEVAYSEWTSAGHLRHPRWRGWRADKEAGDIVVEDA